MQAQLPGVLLGCLVVHMSSPDPCQCSALHTPAPAPAPAPILDKVIYILQLALSSRNRLSHMWDLVFLVATLKEYSFFSPQVFEIWSYSTLTEHFDSE